MFSDLRTWAWIALIVGVLAIVAARGVFSGSRWARWFGIFAAGLNRSRFRGPPGYPFWTLIVFTRDILVIYALSGLRREARRSERPRPICSSGAPDADAPGALLF